MEKFNLNEMRQVLESQMDNPVELNKMGVRMLEVMDEMNKTVIQMDEKLEAELKDGDCKVPPTEEASAASSLPTTPLRLPPMTTPGAPIRPRKIRGFSRWGFNPTRLNFDSPPSSPEKVDVSSLSPAVSKEIPIPLAPLRPRRTSRIDASTIEPIPFSLDFSPERPAEDFPAAMNTPDRPYIQITPSAPVRSNRTIDFNNFAVTPIHTNFGSPPSSPESILESVSSDLYTPERPAPIVVPQAPVQPNRFIKMDHFTASPIRLSFDSPVGSPQRSILQQNQDHSTDVLCTPKIQNNGFMNNLIGAPVRPKRIGRFSVLPIHPCHFECDSSPERQKETDLPSESITPDRRPSMIIPQAPKKNLQFQAWNIEPIPFSLDSDDE